MSIWFAGSEPDCVTGNFAVNTSGSYHDNNAVRCGLGVGTGETLVLSLPQEYGGDSADGWWFHGIGECAESLDASVFDLEVWLTIKDGSGNNIVTCSAIGNASITFTLYGASGGTSAATAWASGYTDDVKKTIDVHVYKSGSDAKLDVYANSALVSTATVASETNRGVKEVQLGGPASGGTITDGFRFWWSEFILADEDTRNYRVGIYYPTGNGTYTAGTGTYADIDEIATDANAIILGASGDRESWTVTMHGAHPAGAIRAVAINGLISSDGTNDLQASIRVGGVNYDSADLGLSGSPTARSTVWNTHPGTSAPWGVTDLTALEYGFEAVA